MPLAEKYIYSCLSLHRILRFDYYDFIMYKINLLVPKKQQQINNETTDTKEKKLKERLRRKAELQKQASQPRSYAESIQAEMARKNTMKNVSPEERRNAMCESLGRGC
jgi:hypothetical protein